MIGFDLALREKFIIELCNQFPFIKCGKIGKSLCNRDIPYVKIGSENNPVLFAAAFHGMEWLTSLLVLLFAKRISQAVYSNAKLYDVDVKKILNERGLVIVPCVNPDGVEISLHGAQASRQFEPLVNEVLNYGDASRWQANARGVDLNHKFDADWEQVHHIEQERGINGPAPTRYGGPFPQSEAETKALVEFCEKMNFRQALAFHSQGEEIYWHYGTNTPAQAKNIADKMAKLSGYTLSKPEGLAVGGGFKDWFISKFAKPSFTIEIGKGKNPLPLTDINSIYWRLENMLVYCCLA